MAGSNLASELEAEFGSDAWLRYEDGGHVETYAASPPRWVIDVTQVEVRDWLVARYNAERVRQGASGFFADNTAPAIPQERGDRNMALLGIPGDTAAQQRQAWYVAHLSLLRGLAVEAPVLANVGKYLEVARDCAAHGLGLFCENLLVYSDGAMVEGWRKLSVIAEVPLVLHAYPGVSPDRVALYYVLATRDALMAAGGSYSDLSDDWSPVYDLVLPQPEDVPLPPRILADPSGDPYWRGEASLISRPGGATGYWRFFAPGYPGGAVRGVDPSGQRWTIHSSGEGWFQVYQGAAVAAPVEGYWELGRWLTYVWTRQVGDFLCYYRVSDSGAPTGAASQPVAFSLPPADGSRWHVVQATGEIGPEAESVALQTGRGAIYRLVPVEQPAPEPEPEPQPEPTPEPEPEPEPVPEPQPEPAPEPGAPLELVAVMEAWVRMLRSELDDLSSRVAKIEAALSQWRPE